MTDTQQDSTDPRQEILEQIDNCTNQRGILLNLIRFATAPEDNNLHEFMNRILQLTDNELARCWKTLDYKNGKIPRQEYMHWHSDNSAIRQTLLIELRALLENRGDKMLPESFEHREFVDGLLQRVKDGVLIYSHDFEQFGAAMENDDSPVKPEHLVHYGVFSIRCSQEPNGGIVPDASDTIAVMRILAGEIQRMDEQPHVCADEAAKEYDRILSQYPITPEMDRFLKWAKTILDG